MPVVTLLQCGHKLNWSFRGVISDYKNFSSPYLQIMEYSDVGAHCYYDLCRQHTYLPFECRYCKHQFCKNHIQSTQHECPNASNIDLNIEPPPNPIQIANAKNTNTLHHNNNNGNIESHGLSFYKCSYSQCNKQSPISILCKDCNQLFCIKHRYPDDHHCGRDLAANNNHITYDDDGYEEINYDFGIDPDPTSQKPVARQLSDSQYETIRMPSSGNSNGSATEVINVYKFNELRKMGYGDKEVYNAWYQLKGQYPSLTSDHPQFMNKILDTLQSQQEMVINDYHYPQQTFDDEKISNDITYPDLTREISKCQETDEFDVENECKKLHDVIGIFTTNKNKTISKETAFARLICGSNMKQRQEIKEYYKKKYMVNLDHYINMLCGFFFIKINRKFAKLNRIFDFVIYTEILKVYLRGCCYMQCQPRLKDKNIYCVLD